MSVNPDAVRSHYTGNIERLEAKMAHNDRVNAIMNNIFGTIIFLILVGGFLLETFFPSNVTGAVNNSASQLLFYYNFFNKLMLTSDIVSDVKRLLA